MHGKFPAIQQNQRNSILFHETIPLIPKTILPNLTVKEQGFLRKSHQKSNRYPLDPGSRKNSSQIQIPDSGGKKAPDPGSQIRIRNTRLGLKARILYIQPDIRRGQISGDARYRTGFLGGFSTQNSNDV
jgi:hypothetical protein